MKRIAGVLIALVSALLISAGSIQAQQGAVWTLEYFNNPYLAGDVVLRQQSQAISYNWGSGSPGANIPADNFSARISTDVFFPAGTYRFYMLADDGAHLYIDFQSQINTFENPRPGQLLTVDVTLPAGTHHIQIDYREYDGNAYMYLDWQNLANNPTGPRFNAPVNIPVIGGAWTGEYFSNNLLWGSPVAIQSENAPRYSWGTGTPLAVVPADNFSARWSSIQFLEGGAYQINVRADDGVRVYVDGVLTINEWHSATGQTYTANLNLTRGNHTFIIEYYEAAGVAFIDYTLTRTDVTSPPVVVTQPPATASVATVLANRLNVRSAPNTITGNIITRITRGETYAVTGKNLNATWWRINVNGTSGWVSGTFVNVTNPGSVPQVSAETPPQSNILLTTTANLNIRSGPGVLNRIIGRIPDGRTAQLIGRNAGNTWLRVNYNGVVGWVSAAFTILPANFDQVPVND